MKAVLGWCLVAFLKVASTQSATEDVSQTLFSPSLYHGISFLNDPQTGACQIIRSEPAQPIRGIPIRRRPASHDEGGSETEDLDFVEVVEKTEELAMQHVNRICFGKTEKSISVAPESLIAGEMEIVKVLDNGPPENRIDVVFMGDGYTAKERVRFFDDIRRLTADMWSGETFQSTLPLFNIWAIYAPSADHGIGIGGEAKNTPFGLYRDGTELRGIYCSKPQAARAACKLTGQAACDFPSLIANDEFYGGLGGEFVISTRSNTSGTIVLRHEMGHNFINVGEEYDGGYVYSGCNSERTLKYMKWKQWLTKTDVVEQRSELLVQDYSWYDLAKGKYKIPFKSDGSFKRWSLKISASGVEVENAMEVYVDGQRLEWQTTGLLDRGFYEWFNETKGFSAGDHALEFRLGVPAKPSAPIRQLCSVTLIEYGSDEEYNIDNSFISAYPTISIAGQKTYRPTHEGCLMRNMGWKTLCSVCQEGLWMNLMSRLSVIDKVESTCKNGKPTLTVIPLPLAQFRESGDLGRNVESYEVRWYKQTPAKPMDRLLIQPDAAGLTDPGWKQVAELDDTFAAAVEPGTWKVDVTFKTIDVRVDQDGVLHSTWQGAVIGC